MFRSSLQDNEEQELRVNACIGEGQIGFFGNAEDGDDRTLGGIGTAFGHGDAQSTDSKTHANLTI